MSRKPKPSTALAPVEVIVPPKGYDARPAEDLDTCLTGLKKATEHHERRSEWQKYDKLAMGLWLLKAQVLHVMPPAIKGGKRKGDVPPGGITPAPDAAEGFLAWIYTHVGRVPARVYELINLALNVGLTPGSTMEDIDAMTKAQVLKDKPLKSLFGTPAWLLPPGQETPSTGADAFTPAEQAQQVFRPFFDDLLDHCGPRDEVHLFELPLISQDPAQPSLSELRRRVETLLDKIKQIESEKRAEATTPRKRRAS